MITAVVVEGRRPAEVAATYGVARSWVYDLVARWRTDGDAAFGPRSRRPHTSPTAIPAATVELIVNLRRSLAAQGLDAGAETIRWHLHTRIVMLIADFDVRTIHATTGEILRHLTIDPTRTYHGTGRPPGRTPRKPRQPDP